MHCNNAYALHMQLGERCASGDRNNLRKIRAHRIRQEEAEWVLPNDPIPVHEQDVEGERRFVYHGETEPSRLLAVIVTERGGKIKVVTAYDLDPRQRRDYIERRLQGE